MKKKNMTIRETIYTKARTLYQTRMLDDETYNTIVTDMVNKFEVNEAIKERIEKEKKSIEESERIAYNEFLSVYDDIRKLNRQISRKIKKDSPDYEIVNKEMEEIQRQMKRWMKPYERSYYTSHDINYERVVSPSSFLRATFRAKIIKGTVFDSLNPYFEKYHIDE